MQTNENTMWPEKIAAIYKQFPWLKRIVPQVGICRAYVKRFDEGTLDIKTGTYQYRNMALFEINLYLVDHVQDTIVPFQGNKRPRWWRALFFSIVHQTVREVIQNLPSASKISHLVLIKYSYPDGEYELTVFKPPQDNLPLRAWYDMQLASVNFEVALDK